jgi:hypothetical protein
MKKENNAIVITSIISGVILLIALIALGTLNSLSPYSRNTVTVEGVANVEATPDLIGVYFNIETKGNTSANAKTEGEEIFDKLVSNLAIEGFDRSELKTQYYNIYPNVYWENGKQKEDGHIASHSLKLELNSDEFDMIGEVIDAGVYSGAGISYINFELSQELQSQYKADALELASKDAKIKAEAVASGFNKNVGRLVSVQVSDFGYYPWNIYTAKASSGASSEDAALARETTMNLVPSEQDISATVSATYRIR